MIISRRKFIAQTTGLAAGSLFFANDLLQDKKRLMTVNGWITREQPGFSLTHEHVLVDFIGADLIDPSRYNAEEVFQAALPKLLELKQRGFQMIMECTPAYIGRDVKLLKRLADASGLYILTNTGYYGAAGEKYLPSHAWKETAEQIAARWISEWKNGVEEGIKPGFIKCGVDKYPLSDVQAKMIDAAAITHLATGLTIGVHSGNGEAAMEELRIIKSKGIRPDAWIWIHAQNESDRKVHIRAAKAGGWVSFDGVNRESISQCIDFLKDMKEQHLLQHVLLSHDSGWYHVGEPGGGTYNDYNTIADKLIPQLFQNGFTQPELQLLFGVNPVRAFTVKVRRI
ncbi:phosphotriesterase family protein [Terrimonas alba]|uniref:phosphotriesterase family protein n=1 Tax=Terrimonas alba TaxID=3349636 RepID=UPI0035F39216